jgi:hypothetical protein
MTTYVRAAAGAAAVKAAEEVETIAEVVVPVVEKQLTTGEIVFLYGTFYLGYLCDMEHLPLTLPTIPPEVALIVCFVVAARFIMLYGDQLASGNQAKAAKAATETANSTDLDASTP